MGPRSKPNPTKYRRDRRVEHSNPCVAVVSMTPSSEHLSAESMQALLDGDLPAREAAACEAHIGDCARCRSEYEGWQVLFDDLGDLAAFSPSPSFRGRILDTLPAEGSTRSRARRAAEAVQVAGTHVGSGALQDHLEGRLAARAATRIDAHLDTCAVCRSDLAALRQVGQMLDSIPRLRPSPEFGLRVMAAWRVEQMAKVVMAPTTRWGRVAAWARTRTPSTRQGWAAVMGVATAPAVVIALLIQAVFANPLVTFGNLAAFARLKASGLFGSVSAQIVGLLESAGLGGAAGIVLDALSSPTVAAGAATVASGLTLGALWVVYRFLIASQPADRPYAHVSR